jgi:hypothetical protein
MDPYKHNVANGGNRKYSVQVNVEMQFSVLTFLSLVWLSHYGGTTNRQVCAVPPFYVNVLRWQVLPSLLVDETTLKAAIFGTKQKTFWKLQDLCFCTPFMTRNNNNNNNNNNNDDDDDDNNNNNNNNDNDNIRQGVSKRNFYRFFYLHSTF